MRKAPRSITMSISAAPASTASAVSASLTGIDDAPRRERRGHRRDDDAGTLEPLDGDAREIGVDADRCDRRDLGVVGVGPHGLRAQRADLAGRVRALQRGQVDHGDGHVDRLELGVLLDGAGGEDGRAALQPDLVDAGQPVKEPPQRRLVAHRVGERRGNGGGHVAESRCPAVIAAGGTPPRPQRRPAPSSRSCRASGSAVGSAQVVLCSRTTPTVTSSSPPRSKSRRSWSALMVAVSPSNGP